ncbi:MFS transporter [Curtobacterium sp. MCBD17_019]|uniref:MFS transporter n=1 Tax=Curtobacterium sp. MCBD17_019 TaxID=2175669 RepID=UPI0015E8983B|nr:MFS transporter [Curtobacterium sp. MCBD17_019]
MNASTTTGLRGWSALLAPTDRRHLAAAGLVARIPLAVVGFSVLFFVRSVTGSFADAGFASGVAIAASALTGPVFGRVADRRGQRGALLVAAVGHPVAVVLLVAAGTTRQSLVVLTVAVLLVGATIVPAGAFTRARWTAMVDAGSGIHLAFSLEAIADELVWVFGPALAALVSAAVDPAAGLVASGVFGAAGCLWLRRGVGRGPTGGVSVTRRAFVPWRSRRVMALLVSSVALGLTFGVNDVTVVAWATEAGLPQIAGLVLTAYSIGSVTGGVLMSAVPSRVPPFRLLLAASAAVAVFWSALALSPGLGWLFPLGLFAGATITPFTISTNRVLHQEVHGAVFTEAVAWVSACVAGAMALGSFVGGVVGQAGGDGFRVVAISAPAVLVVIAVATVLPPRRQPG